MGLKLSKPADEGYTQLNDTKSAFDKHPINQPDVPETEFKVYKRRYYILIMFSVASILQILIWNTWAPIANTAITVLGWTQADIALLSMWGGIISAFVCIPFAGIMDKFGLRILVLLAETLGLIGAAIRCIPVPIEYLKWTANVGQFFIALAGPFLVQGPSLMSAAWFPPHQRTTATAVAQTSMGAGVALSFVLGPMFVKDSAQISPDTLQTDIDGYGNDSLPDGINPVFKQKRIDEIYRILYMECILLAVMCAAAWVYYPAVPPTPPSVSASKTREDFLPGLKILVRSGNAFWLPAVAYGVIIGVPGTWATQLVIMFQGTVGLSQDTVSWIAFYTYIGGVLGALAASRCVDYLGGKMKLVILALTTPAFVVFVWLMLICNRILSYNLPSLYISTILYGTLIKASRPIYLEMTCEGMYPVAEGITIGTLNWLDNIYGLVFFFIMMIPNIGQRWMNWAVLGSMIIAYLLLVVFKEESKRLALDKQIVPTKDDEEGSEDDSEVSDDDQEIAAEYKEISEKDKGVAEED